MCPDLSYCRKYSQPLILERTEYTLDRTVSQFKINVEDLYGNALVLNVHSRPLLCHKSATLHHSLIQNCNKSSKKNNLTKH